MGRVRRKDGPGRIFHLTARVNWRVWHLEDTHAKEVLSGLVTQAAEAFDVRLLAAILMDNHFHAVAQSPSKERFAKLTSRRTRCRHLRPYPRGHQKCSVIAQFMRSIRRSMSVRRHRELDLSGQFWEGPYDSRPVLSATSLVIRIAYDHRNPVKAGMVARPEDHPWSSASQWVTGREGPIPVDFREPLPFGLTTEELRARVLHQQASKRLDDCREQLHDLFADPDGEDESALLAILAEHKVDACGTDAARHSR